MNSTLKIALVFSVTLLCIIGVAGIFGSRWIPALATTVSAPPPSPPLESYLPGLNLQGLNYEVSEKGKRQWGFKAGEVVQSKDGRTTTLNGLHDGVYYKDGKPYLAMKSGSAVYDHFTKQLKMNGGVQVTGPDGLRFNAPALTFTNDNKVIICPGPVQFQTSEGWLTSNGTLKADLKRQTFSMEQVSGQFSLDAAKGVPL